MYRNIGEPIALHLGAPGKVMLAFAPPAEIAAYLASGPLASTTHHSVTDPEILGEELATIAKQGYAVSWEERTLGVVSLAAPIFDATGAVVASVNVSGPSQRIRKQDVRTFVPLVVGTARGISHGIGYLDAGAPVHRGAARDSG
jgi:DNA-binding IclR family transcriptional regulator